VTIVYHCESVGEVRLNGEHSEYGFFDVLPGGLHPYLLEVVRDSGWRPGGGGWACRAVFSGCVFLVFLLFLLVLLACFLVAMRPGAL